MSSKVKRKIVYGDSIDGRFISRNEALKRPATTEKQKLQPPKSIKGERK